jgi:hypothetical protein
MSYEIGTHIDLTYLNRKAVATAPKKSVFNQTFEQASNTEVEVGTSYNFQNGKAARRIEVLCI